MDTGSSSLLVYAQHVIHPPKHQANYVQWSHYPSRNAILHGKLHLPVSGCMNCWYDSLIEHVGSQPRPNTLQVAHGLRPRSLPKRRWDRCRDSALRIWCWNTHVCRCSLSQPWALYDFYPPDSRIPYPWNSRSRQPPHFGYYRVQLCPNQYGDPAKTIQGPICAQKQGSTADLAQREQGEDCVLVKRLCLIPGSGMDLVVRYWLTLTKVTW